MKFPLIIEIITCFHIKRALKIRPQCDIKRYQTIIIYYYGPPLKIIIFVRFKKEIIFIYSSTQFCSEKSAKSHIPRISDSDIFLRTNIFLGHFLRWRRGGGQPKFFYALCVVRIPSPHPFHIQFLVKPSPPPLPV